MTRAALLIALLAVTACARALAPPTPEPTPVAAGRTAEMDALVARMSAELDVPAELMHRVIQRESGYNPAARNGPYYGLMQILPQTAATMGYDGPPEGLLDAETNLRYAGRYLRGAWIVADGDMDAAVGWYSSGYYYEARDRCLLVATGLGSRERC